MLRAVQIGPASSRRSSGVERALGKGEVESSILSGGTIYLNNFGQIMPEDGLAVSQF